ncbi:CRISPR-associated endonuclease Cas3'' [Paracoccus sp. pheM1]|uniref:CRISPR-associated endonuclease Cas3'' n=1 Tax=Paracoccus sp. pheM1 TaxID=2831675 RepID=UPI001BDB8115|nr:CRISPR-associated endonuclease Cas3'' [Paracoccus sp. pheM1]MBT0780367.1 CRISPR-associated endonuclease Cas3'' [Paracoccus sp. pheM1]
MANYCAHTGSRKDRADWQLPADQLRNTAALAATRGAPLGLQAAAHVAGLFHDFGKYDPTFGRLLDGQNVRGEHSTAGAALLYAQAPAGMSPCAEVIGHAILGQHAGLPDRYGADSSMERRLDACRDPIAPEISAAAGSDFGPFARELAALDAAGLLRFRSVGRRAHGVFRDTESFYAGLEGRQPDRTWPALADLLPDWRRALDTHMAQFDRAGPINRLRADILAHVRRGAAMAPGLFTLTVPTGGGKTLASLGFALDHAAGHGHRRIISAIPYTEARIETPWGFRPAPCRPVASFAEAWIETPRPMASRSAWANLLHESADQQAPIARERLKGCKGPGLPGIRRRRSCQCEGPIDIGAVPMVRSRGGSPPSRPAPAARAPGARTAGAAQNRCRPA